MQIFIKDLTHYILCNPCTPSLCDSQCTESKNNTSKSYLPVKRKSVNSFTPNSSSRIIQEGKKKKSERKQAATWNELKIK